MKWNETENGWCSVDNRFEVRPTDNCPDAFTMYDKELGISKVYSTKESAMHGADYEKEFTRS